MRLPTAGELNERFGVGEIVRFEEEPRGFVRAAVRTREAEAHVYLHGAHVTHYRPHQQRPVLFLSAGARFERGLPIRGGVPVVFPWFGPRPGHPRSPAHGVARTAIWQVETASPDGALVLRLTAEDAAWSQAFVLRHRVRVGASLELSLEVENASGQALAFEEALHTYLAVSDVRSIGISGLGGATYLDKTRAMARTLEEHDPLRLTAETDRVYVGTNATCVIDDPGWGRRLVVDKEGSRTTVVWNPWSVKARAIADFVAEEWSRMVCVETANVGDDTVVLPAGGRHTLRTVIRSDVLA
jgi:glucose-6-phosphate 1-epimerase